MIGTGIWLVLLIAISVYIRLSGADAYSYSQDEAMHMGMAKAASPAEVWQFSMYETHPPLGNLMRYYWLKMADSPEWARDQSLLFGVALILIYYSIGRFCGGPFTGLCCAALISFSLGCIIQSYVVRNYIFFAFFLSCGLYCYLRWRRSRNVPMLLAYGLFSSLACLTHFSGMFTVACFVVVEGMDQLRSRTLKGHAAWLAMNALILAMTLLLYVSWLPVIRMVDALVVTPLQMRVLYAFSYPLGVSTYLFPTDMAALAVVALPLALVFYKPSDQPAGSQFPFLFRLSWIGLALGMLLILTGLYAFPGTRRSMWMLPLLVPAAGYLLAVCMQWIGGMVMKSGPLLWYNIALFLITAAGWTSYDPEKRYLDTVEYSVENHSWQRLADYLSTLGLKDVIVAERDDAVLLENIYPYMGDPAHPDRNAIAFAPYRHTHILFSPYNRRLHGDYQLVALLQKASAQHLLDGAQRLVFLRTAITHWPINNLMRCAQLEGKTFTPSQYNPSGRNIFVMSVPLKDITQDLLPDQGKAHGCLDFTIPAP